MNDRAQGSSGNGAVDAVQEFKTYCMLSDRLIRELTKDQVAECARMLALHVADYRQRFGEIPHSALLTSAGAVGVDPEQTALLRDGMEVLLGYLASLREGLDDGLAY